MPSHKYSYILHEYVILNSLGYLLSLFLLSSATAGGHFEFNCQLVWGLEPRILGILESVWETGTGTGGGRFFFFFFFFRVFQAGEGKRKAREEAPDTGKRLQGEAEKNNAYPYIIDCSIPPPNTPLNDATNYSGSSKRSNCQ